jgi:hypothetical protein
MIRYDSMKWGSRKGPEPRLYGISWRGVGQRGMRGKIKDLRKGVAVRYPLEELAQDL